MPSTNGRLFKTLVVRISPAVNQGYAEQGGRCRCVIGRYIAERLVELQLAMQDLVEDRVGVPQH